MSAHAWTPTAAFTRRGDVRAHLRAPTLLPWPILVLAVLAGIPATSGAAPPDASATTPAQETRVSPPLLDKKTQWLRDKARRAAEESSDEADSPDRSDHGALRPVWAFSLHQRELLILDARRPPTKAQIDAFLRCRFSTQEADMPAALIARMLEAAAHFDATRVVIVSGYRSPKLNLALRKKGRQVAATSQHTRGQAVDFQLPGVPVRALYRWLLKNHDGGVGYYATSEFVHIDTGRKRTWRGT